MLKYLLRKQPSVQGFTLIETMTVVVIVGVLAAIGAPLFFVDRPLQSATSQTEGIFRQARMRAIATTSAYRVRPLPGGRFQVEASTTRGCEASTELSAAALATDTSIRVFSTRGFAEDDRINVGSLQNLNIRGIDEGTSTISFGSTPLGSAQAAGAAIELAGQWSSNSAITNFTAEDLTLPSPRNAQEALQIAAVPNWTLCFNSRGVASLFNSRTGRPINGNLVLSLTRVDKYTNTPIADSQAGTVTVFQGGGVSTNAQTLNQ